MQVVLRAHGDGYVSDRNLRASDFDGALGETNNPEWKTIVFDEKSNRFVAPNGSIGFVGVNGKWNLLPKNAASQEEIQANCLAKARTVPWWCRWASPTSMRANRDGFLATCLPEKSPWPMARQRWSLRCST